MKGTRFIANFLMTALLLSMAAGIFTSCSDRFTRAAALYEKGESCNRQGGIESYLESKEYYKGAVKLFQKAAKRGNAEAQYRLGFNRR
mgnify:FL=1